MQLNCLWSSLISQLHAVTADSDSLWSAFVFLLTVQLFACLRFGESINWLALHHLFPLSSFLSDNAPCRQMTLSNWYVHHLVGPVVLVAVVTTIDGCALSEETHSIKRLMCSRSFTILRARLTIRRLIRQSTQHAFCNVQMELC